MNASDTKKVLLNLFRDNPNITNRQIAEHIDRSISRVKQLVGEMLKEGIIESRVSTREPYRHVQLTIN